MQKSGGFFCKNQAAGGTFNLEGQGGLLWASPKEKPARRLVIKRKEEKTMAKKFKLAANILFGGIGFQERGFENTGVIDLEVLAVSEIDGAALISRAAIHEGMTPETVEKYDSYPGVEEMTRELSDKNIGNGDGKARDWNRLRKSGVDVIKKTWLASRLSRNCGDISKIESLPEADLWFISFPCTDISTAGHGKGFEEGSGTKSSLLHEALRILKKSVRDGTQPKFLIFENVKALVSKKFMEDFQKLLGQLSGLGYESRHAVINAQECGIPQNRERVFVISSRNDIDMSGFAFPEPFECDAKMEDSLCRGFEKNVSLNPARRDAIAEALGRGGRPNPEGKPGRAGRKPENPGREDGAEAAAPGKRGVSRPVTRLTPEMCFSLMGMTEEDAGKCRALGVSDSQMCKQAGNGIVTNCVQLIGEHLYKAIADPSFVCTDEMRNKKKKKGDRT